MKNRLLLSFTCMAALAFQTSTMAAPLSSDQVQQVQQIVHNYLVNNPQVLVEASEALQKQEMQKIEKNAQSTISKYAKQIFADSGSPVVGNANGKVTLVEFFDYQCPHCKDMSSAISNVMSSDKNLRVVFKELPIFGGNSKFAAQAALAAYKQGADKYLQFHNSLMAAANPLNEEKILSIAKTSGLNVDQLKKDMSSSDVKQEIENNFKLAQALSIMGTPTFVIGKWENGAVSKTSFIPGATTEANLQKLVRQAG